MIVGYARSSTIDQEAGFEAQLRDLQAAGCEKIFSEKLSGIDRQRPEFLAAMQFVREGDKLVVTKLERLARSTRHLLEIEADLTARRVALRILNLGIDTSTPTGRLLFTMVAAVGQFEREIMLERQLEGIAKAKADGKYKGRAPTALAKAEDVWALKRGGIAPTEIARQLSISRSSVYRILEGN